MRAGIGIFFFTLGILGLVECTGRLLERWFQPVVADYGLGFTEDSRVFIPDPKDPRFLITSPLKCMSFHDQRFSLHKASDVRRVFIVGGSCVALLQDGSDSPLYSRVEKAIDIQFEKLAFPGFPGRGLSLLRELLDERFGGAYHFEVINCGAGSYGSHRLVPVVAEILNYEPDLILYYEGHNEFEEIEQIKYVPVKTLRLQAALEHLAVYRLIRSQVTTFRSRQLVRPENRRLLAKPFPQFITAESCRPGFGEADIQSRMAQFESNLELMAELCRRHDVPLILPTAPSNLMKPQLCKDDLPKYQPVFDLYHQGRFDEARELGERVLAGIYHRQATEAENMVFRRVAAHNHLPLADIKSAMIAAEPHRFLGETLFWDNCHLYPKGNEVLLTTFFKTIRDNLSFSSSPAKIVSRF